MGPQCRCCGTSCFCQRILRDGRSVLLATCTKGMHIDRATLGQDHTTAINPLDVPAERVA